MNSSSIDERATSKPAAFTITRDRFDAVIFDLDGVVTRTAEIHAAAWKKLFDEYLERHVGQHGGTFQPFDIEGDYHKYVDGKPRYDGVKSFLESRQIDLPYGAPDDPPGRETVCGLGNQKNRLFLDLLKQRGVKTYSSTIELIRSLRSKNIRTAIVSSSKNCGPVLETAGIADLFDTKVDGKDSAELNLKGKPAPDIFIEACRRLGVKPARAIVVEDAISGVEAGRHGNFRFVIGVDRAGQSAVLKKKGADIVVTDLSEITSEGDESNSSMDTKKLPSALQQLDEIKTRIANKELGIFLDYDGTLTPIVRRPEDAVLSGKMKTVLREVAKRYSVAVVSGRDLRDVQKLVDLDGIFYAGSHGFEITGPNIYYQYAENFLPVLDEAESEIRSALEQVSGVVVERKKFSIAVHYRAAAQEDIPTVEKVVDHVSEGHPELRKAGGKKIFELQPKVEWNKGKAVLRLLEALGMNKPEVIPMYIGDDLTDEDAFRVIRESGIGIVVREESRPTEASYALDSTDEVHDFLLAISNLQGVKR
jgi:trehalose-phosphatase